METDGTNIISIQGVWVAFYTIMWLWVKEKDIKPSELFKYNNCCLQRRSEAKEMRSEVRWNELVVGCFVFVLPETEKENEKC